MMFNYSSTTLSYDQVQVILIWYANQFSIIILTFSDSCGKISTTHKNNKLEHLSVMKFSIDLCIYIYFFFYTKK